MVDLVAFRSVPRQQVTEAGMVLEAAAHLITTRVPLPASKTDFLNRTSSC